MKQLLCSRKTFKHWRKTSKHKTREGPNSLRDSNSKEQVSRLNVVFSLRANSISLVGHFSSCFVLLSLTRHTKLKYCSALLILYARKLARCRMEFFRFFFSSVSLSPDWMLDSAWDLLLWPKHSINVLMWCIWTIWKLLVKCCALPAPMNISLISNKRCERISWASTTDMLVESLMPVTVHIRPLCDAGLFSQDTSVFNLFRQPTVEWLWSLNYQKHEQMIFISMLFSSRFWPWA